MDFLRLIILMFVELIHTSHQVNDHPEGLNTLLDKLIKDTESRFGYNKTTILKEKADKNLNDSKIVYVKTQVDPDILFKSNMTQNSSEKNKREDKLVENIGDEIEVETFDKDKHARNDNYEIKKKVGSRRNYDGNHSDEEVYTEIIEENMSNFEENEDIIFEKEITYDITENTQNHSNPSLQFSSLIDAVARSGSRIKENAKKADMAEDPSDHNPQSNGENISKSDLKKVLHNYNIVNDFDKGNRENNSDIRKLLNVFKHDHSQTRHKSQPESSVEKQSFNSPPIIQSGLNEVFHQIVNDEKLKSILESLKLDELRNAVKSNENVLPEVDIDKVKENLKILEGWDKRYNIFHSTVLPQNNTESKQQPQLQEHQDYDIKYRNGFDIIPREQGHLFQVPKAHFIPPLSKPRFIFPTQNKIKCCTHTNVIGNPWLGILPTPRLGLINSVNRMTSGFVYKPLYYPY